MTIKKSNLYILSFSVCLIGYLYIAFQFNQYNSASVGLDVCIFKNLTTIPCPSCGSTRAILALVSGDVLTAIYLNPFSILIVGIMIILPLWILLDGIMNSSSFYKYYCKIESIMQKPKYGFCIIILVICNWTWNIIKMT